MLKKTDFNKKFKNDAFENLLTKAAMTHFPENDEKGGCRNYYLCVPTHKPNNGLKTRI